MMTCYFLLLCAVVIRLGICGSDYWAFLVAGSRGIENYRHQADVCHTYSMLMNGGINMSQVVVMMYDDVAWSSLNPLIGRLYNEPNGNNVYETCRVDIKGEDVNCISFSKILTNTVALRGTPVRFPRINSNQNSTVFISFVDHGQPGQLLFPSEDSLTGPALLNTINAMSFKRVVIYVEACFSGSVFESIPNLPKNVIAVTASNATESSWGTFCPTPKHPDADAINGVHIGTCLGDLFEVSWKRDLEDRIASGSFTNSTLGEHVEAIRSLVSRKSNVMVYGDMDLLNVPLIEVFPFAGHHLQNGNTPQVPWEVVIESAKISYPVAHQPWHRSVDNTLLAA
jgi:legumain